MGCAGRRAAGSAADVWALLALIGAPATWAAGSVLSVRRRVQMGSIATSALQHVVGAIFFVGVALLAREPFPTPTTEAMWGWIYLVVIGSIVTFTSFLRAL